MSYNTFPPNPFPPNSENGGDSYTLPIASDDMLGGVKIGEGLNIDSSGVLSTSNFIFGTFSGTTSEVGVLSPSPAISANNKHVISAYGDTSKVIIPLVAASDNTWRFMVLFSATMEPAKEVPTTINYVVINKHESED